MHVPALGNCRGLIMHCLASTLQGIYNNSRDEKAVIEKKKTKKRSCHSMKSSQIKSVTVNGHFKWIRMFSVIGVVWNCKFQFLEMRIFLIQNVTCLVIMRLWKELCRDVIDEIQQPAQTGIEINFHFHQSNSFYDNVLEFCGVCA